MGLLDAIAPDGMAEVLRIQAFRKKQDLKVLGQSIFIEENKAKTKFIIVYEFAFATKKECEIFRDMNTLARKASEITGARD